MRKLVLMSLMLGFVNLSKAQEHVFFTGFFPEFAATKSLKNGQKLNFKVENQEIFFRNLDEESERWQFRHYRTDLMSFYSWSLSPVSSVAGGIFYRFQDGANAFRVVQQFAFLDRNRTFRIAHRFRTDQTFTDGEATEFRFRYRLAVDIPLQGEDLDPGEYYLVLSNEPIFSFQGGEFDIENRLATTIGKLISKKQKLEYSVDYRTDGYFQDGFRTRLWAKIGYFLNF
ncbi:MAG: protein of unknown function DUF2490 [Algoriphagus marincola HL-49]|uniref:DUF2490 domain-containing protein n=1 Tax=Algoriphagus marincola HL-49 TaxID=1305737 RepID=A0A0P7YI66_9BACT|nr:MAG: protein of unknown function DUF2490 [Algoriphagus marincola HL-49]